MGFKSVDTPAQSRRGESEKWVDRTIFLRQNVDDAFLLVRYRTGAILPTFIHVTGQTTKKILSKSEIMVEIASLRHKM